MNPRSALLRLLLPPFFLLAAQAQAEASSFYLQEQSIRAQGAAYAGAAAQGEDASVLFFNPAALTELEGPSATLGAALIMPKAHFKNHGSTGGLTAALPGGQAAYAGITGGNPFSPTPLPSLFAARPFEGGKYWLGLGISTPFGLANEYDDGWFGRYDSTKSKLRTTDISPVLAVRVNDRLSLGGGPDFQYADALLESALPCPTAGAACGAVFSPASDGVSRLEGTSWKVGYNIGALWRINDRTRLGLHYRSAITHEVDGYATVAGLAGGLAAFNGRRAAKSDLKLPDVAEAGLAYDASPRLTWLASLARTGWNSFDEIRVRFDSGLPDNVTKENYKNSWSTSLGAEWRQNARLTFRGGLQYDRTPTTTPDRSTRTPDGDKYWVALGASYALGPALSIDAAASHAFMTDGDIDLTKRIYAGSGADTTVHVRGVTENSLDVVSLSATLKF